MYILSRFTADAAEAEMFRSGVKEWCLRSIFCHVTVPVNTKAEDQGGGRKKVRKKRRGKEKEEEKRKRENRKVKRERMGKEKEV